VSAAHDDACGCFPSGRHWPGIAHLIGSNIQGVAREFDAQQDWAALPVALLDVETTGRDAAGDRIVELGVVIGRGGEIIERRGWLVNPQRPIPAEATAVHHITDADVAGAPTFAELVPEVLAVLTSAVPAAYNAEFDRGFLVAEVARTGAAGGDAWPPALRREVDWIDPLVWARELQSGERSRTLGEVARRLGIDLENAHRATDDAEAALRVLYAFGKDARMPRSYGALVQEQRRLARAQADARARWRRG
jgi:DNA polymerase-3 subunit epsilon